ncbi:MAG TPA: sigma 54-interacting transcriptional regulator [Thermoanaerobaculia bacterium]|jgi:DNA-binding NtrC family response regulator|nr:sigma 54-interacting transcriptional regulator [Thermoanaerobaculia bacterium]HQN10072.1 sigma 54-interacting transcriptional regulator [Thermoanaerobaculia bacterium]HQP86389.1 sigma 54-interacting transcriptional regulator [Thermoanaerobaculia bacterium]
MLRLVIRYRHEALVFPFPVAEVTLGSSSKADLVVPFPGVSRLHARISPEADGIRIVDAGSKNGVIRDGQRTLRAGLREGDEVLLGDATLALQEAGEAEDLALELGALKRGAAPPTGSTASGPLDAPAAALRLVRELEGDGRETPTRRRALLRKARTILGAQGLVALDSLAASEPAFLDVDGPAPDKALIETLRAVVGKRTSSRAPLPLFLAGGQSVALAPATSSLQGPCLIALFSELPGAEVSWKRELLAFLASRLLSPTEDADDPSPPAGARSLRLPEALVLGSSPAFASFLATLEATVGSGLDALLTGETGTGKELIARAIHDSGPHPDGPFVAINCAAIPNELLEAELFGVTRGAATGVEARPGRFLQANGGTLFLDEIGELPEPLQAKLLRVVQEREVLSLGGASARRIHVRIVAATNRDLLRRMKEGLFRPDLYYRLSALQYHVPPLRDRREDIPALVLAFASRSAASLGRRVRGVSRPALDVLLSHDWPGNVRELETAVQRAVLLCPSGGTLLAEHFSQVRWAVEERAREAVVLTPVDVLGAPQPCSPPPFAVPGDLDLEARRNAVEKETIERALATAKGNKSLTARLLRISRNGLAARMKALGIGE